ncbi:MAG TPA: S8/S53 family peptidase, partial [Bacteroidia bacterium]
GTYSDTTFNYISTCQYFKLLRKNGTSNIQPTLGYDASSCVAQLFPSPTVVGFNGTKWKDLGITNLTFSISGGTAGTATTITQYGAITFGIYNPLYASNYQGDSCYNSVTMPSGATSTITGFSQTKRTTWFTFTPTTSEVKVTLTNTSMGANHIRAIALMEGSCLSSNSAGLDSSATDTTLRIVLHEAQIGMPYFIVTINDLQSCPTCTYSPTTFNLQAQSLTPPTQTISNGVAYLNNVPSHMYRQIIIRVNKSHLNMSNVNNTSMLSGTVAQFIDTFTISKIALALYSGNTTIVKNLAMTKIFPSMTSADTLSLSRDSVTVRVPDFFENFILTVSEKDKIFYNSRLLNSILDGGEPNYVVEPASVPNDPNYAASQPNLHLISPFSNANINVESAWDIETGQSFVKVGIYDSGIDGTHDELSGKVAGGYNYAGSPNAPIPPNQNYDGYFHGTACAGVIGAYRNNSIGVAGIAGGDASASNPGCTLYDMRIFDVSGNPVPVSGIANAIHDGATSTGAGGYGLHIMNNSYGQASYGATTTLHDAIQYAVQNGVIFVASRGNWFDPSLNGTTCIVTPPNIDDVQYPSCYPDEMVINVGASGTDGEWKTIGNGDNTLICDNDYQSMTKHNVDVIAPGTTALVQTTNHTTDNYRQFSGTSAACPHVSGVAALMLSHVDQPYSSPNNLVIEDVENILQTSAVDKTASPASVGYDDYSGWGLLDATAALTKINAPNYKIQHFGVGQNVTSVSTSTTVLNGGNYELIQLLTPYQGLAVNTYRAYKVLVTITLNYHLSSPTDQIITAWPRYSSTVGWDITDAFNKNNWCQIISVSSTQAVLQTYVYDFFALSNGTSITDPWFPVHYSNAKVALSIYTQTGVSGIDKLNANNMVMGLYPNPANNSTTVNVTLSSPQKISLEVYDVQGRLVKNVANERISEGLHQYPISLGDISGGVYYVRLVTETSTYGKKLIVTK